MGSMRRVLELEVTVRDLTERLSNVTACLETVMAHYRHTMPRADQLSRDEAIKEAHAMISYVEEDTKERIGE